MSAIERKNSAPAAIPQENWRTNYVRRMVSIRTGYNNEGAPDRYASITQVVSQRLSHSASTLPDYKSST